MQILNVKLFVFTTQSVDKHLTDISGTFIKDVSSFIS